MKYLRLVGIAILAICAVSALAASTASAAKITYSGSGKFTVTSGAGKLETVGGTQITCKGDFGTGQLGKSTATTAELTVSFTGCELLGKKCKSTGAAAGLIDTHKLLATLGEIETGKKGGALLKPAAGAGQPFLVPVLCAETEFSVKGSVIGEFTTALDKQTSVLNIKFALGETKGTQAVTKFVGGAENVLESTIEGTTEHAGLESAEALTLEGGSGQLLA